MLCAPTLITKLTIIRDGANSLSTMFRIILTFVGNFWLSIYKRYVIVKNNLTLGIHLFSLFLLYLNTKCTIINRKMTTRPNFALIWKLVSVLERLYCMFSRLGISLSSICFMIFVNCSNSAMNYCCSGVELLDIYLFI